MIDDKSSESIAYPLSLTGICSHDTVANAAMDTWQAVSIREFRKTEMTSLRRIKRANVRHFTLFFFKYELKQAIFTFTPEIRSSTHDHMLKFFT
jgi:hypothetical protein